MRHLSARKAGILGVSIASLAVGCGASNTNNSNNEECPRSCPISSFTVAVPADRVADVASVTPAGPCKALSVAGSAPGFYFFSVTGDGVCQVTVSFKSGARDFVGSVNIAPFAGPCCVGQPMAQSTGISVPELGGLDAAPGN